MPPVPNVVSKSPGAAWATIEPKEKHAANAAAAILSRIAFISYSEWEGGKSDNGACLPRVDLNCAGAQRRPRSPSETDIERTAFGKFRKLFVQLYAAWHCKRLLRPHLEASVNDLFHAHLRLRMQH